VTSAFFELGIILALVVANGVFVMAEIAVVSARKARLIHRAESGDRRAQEAIDLIGAPADFLATVQIGITLIGILAGALGGATLSAKLAAAMAPLPWIGAYSQPVGFALVVLLIAYLSLVVGELVPKHLAMVSPEAIAMWAVKPMRLLSRVTSPVVRLLTSSTDLVLRALAIEASSRPFTSEDEIRILVEQGARSGLFETSERTMIENVFHLGDRRIGSFMVPRASIVWLDLDDSPGELARKLAEHRCSRYPVASETLDQTIGVVETSDILPAVMRGDRIDLKKLCLEPLFVPESFTALKVLEIFKNGPHLALVVGEHGAVQGLVTVNDILESLVGEMREAGDVVDDRIVPLSGGGWLFDGRLPMDEFRSLLKIDAGVEEEDSATLGGFVMARLGRVPTVGDQFGWQGFTLDVSKMAGLRVAKVRVKPA
jgi:putative hemolysin